MPAQRPDEPAGAEPSRRWRVWRQDDHGNRFEISRGHSEDEARRIAEEFERRGHKQSYGIEPLPPDGPTRARPSRCASPRHSAGTRPAWRQG